MKTAGILVPLWRFREIEQHDRHPESQRHSDDD
jgi:hypothetical protein